MESSHRLEDRHGIIENLKIQHSHSREMKAF